MALVDEFIGSSCHSNMASKNGPETAHYNHDLKYPTHSVDYSGEQLPEPENGDPTLSPSGNCKTPLIRAVSYVSPFIAGDVTDLGSNSIQKTADINTILGRSRQTCIRRENISPAIDILEGENNTIITSFGCHQLTSPSACSSSSEGSILVDSSTH
jgi:hypothetical protein